jgi:predicted kinase
VGGGWAAGGGQDHRGPPASGRPETGSALLDKDTLYGPFVSAVLAAADRPDGEREGPWYDEHIKVHEYAGMTATAREIRSHGCPVLLSGPFTRQIHNAAHWQSWVTELGGGPVHLVWVRSDAATLQHRLTARASGRDTAKLARFREFTDRMRLGAEPAAPHTTIDNRLSTAAKLADQVAGLVTGLTRAVGGLPPLC